jgi:hypothetical protein
MDLGNGRGNEVDLISSGLIKYVKLQTELHFKHIDIVGGLSW